MKLVSCLFGAALLTANTAVFAAKGKSHQDDFKIDLFVDSYVLGESDDLSFEEAKAAGYEFEESNAVPLTKGTLKTITQQIAKDLEAHFFSRSDEFWPTWDTSKIQILLINQSSDFAYLLNNQNSEIDNIGARIEYSARTINDVDIKVNQFGLTKINGIDTYYYNMDLFAEFGALRDTEGLYQEHMSTLVHEAVHVLAQSDPKTVDIVELGESMRGTTFPIDIESRYYRNEVAYYLSKAINASKKAQKETFTRNALYFHDLYLKEDKQNKGHDPYDHAEGMAEYATNAFMALLDSKVKGFNAVHDLAGSFTAENMEYHFGGLEQDQFSVINWGREYYDIGSLAYAVALGLGHTDILRSGLSPLSFLAQKHSSLKAPATAPLKKVVYEFYGGLEHTHKARQQEIERVMSDSNNILIDFEESGDGTMSIESDSIIYHHEGVKGLFDVRSQEIKFGDNRIKLTGQHVLSVYDEDTSDAFDPESSDASELEELPFLLPRLIIPVNENSVEFNGDRLTIQTDNLVMFDVKFKRDGRKVTLLKN